MFREYRVHEGACLCLALIVCLRTSFRLVNKNYSLHKDIIEKKEKIVMELSFHLGADLSAAAKLCIKSF